MEKARELYWDIPENKNIRGYGGGRDRDKSLSSKQNNFDTAFLLAQLHLQKEGRYYAAQWLAGWIALRYANKPEQAPLFLEMYDKFGHQ